MEAARLGGPIVSIDPSTCWTVIIEVSSPDMNIQTIRRALDQIEGVETVAISFAEDDARHVLGPNADTLTVDIRSGAA